MSVSLFEKKRAIVGYWLSHNKLVNRFLVESLNDEVFVNELYEKLVASSELLVYEKKSGRCLRFNVRGVVK